jgi:CheY-like chemotaxis protein
LDEDAKAIVSSGYAKDPIMSNYKKYGFVGVVPKPYNIEELSQELHRVLAG